MRHRRYSANETAADEFDLSLHRLIGEAQRNRELATLTAHKAKWWAAANALNSIRRDVRAMMDAKRREETDG